MSLECYWKLVSADAEERTRAAHDLVASLREGAAKRDGNGHEGPDQQQEQQQEPLPANLDYAVKRLVRGLSSSTEAARQVSLSAAAAVSFDGGMNLSGIACRVAVLQSEPVILHHAPNQP